MKETLEDIGAADRPTVMVFNKVDLLTDRTILQSLPNEYPRCVFISAARGINIMGLKEEVRLLIEHEFVEESFKVSQENQKLVSQLHGAGEVLERTYEDNDVIMRMRIRRKDRERLQNLVSKESKT